MSTTSCVEGFHARFKGPAGEYAASYAPDDLGGLLLVTVGNDRMGWSVEVANSDLDSWSLEGMSSGSVAPWGDTFWFVVRKQCNELVLQLWGDQVLVREDIGRFVGRPHNR